jgi:hypothetical protein
MVRNVPDLDPAFNRRNESKSITKGFLEKWHKISVLKVLGVLKRGDDICDEWGRTNTVLKLQRIFHDKKHMFI